MAADSRVQVALTLALAVALAVTAPPAAASTVADELQPIVVLMEAGQYDQAEQALARLLAQHPDHAAVLDQQMRLRYFQQRPDEALALADKLAAADPRNASPVNMRGLVRMERGDLAGALAEFERALAIDARSGKAVLNRARVLCALGRAAEADRDFDAAGELVGRATMLPQKVACHHVAGREDLALAAASELVQVSPTWLNYLRRKDVRYAMGDKGGAYEDSLRADALRASANDARVLDVANLTAAGQAQAALPIIDALIALHPDSPCLHFLRGDALNALGRADEALAAYDRSLASDAQSRAQEYHRRKQYKLVAAECTNHARPRAMRGQIRLARGDHDGALEDFESAIGSGLSDPGALYGRGAVKALRDDFDGAIADIEEAESYSPGFYAEALARVRDRKAAKIEEQRDRERLLELTLADDSRSKHWRECAESARQEMQALEARGVNLRDPSSASFIAYENAASRGLGCLQKWVRAADSGEVAQPPPWVDRLGEEFASDVESLRELRDLHRR